MASTKSKGDSRQDRERAVERRVTALRSVRRRLHRMFERLERLRARASEVGHRRMAVALEAAEEEVLDLRATVTRALVREGGVPGGLVCEPDPDSTRGRASTPLAIAALVADWVEADREAVDSLIGSGMGWQPQTTQDLLRIDEGLELVLDGIGGSGGHQAALEGPEDSVTSSSRIECGWHATCSGAATEDDRAACAV